jgi:hypothetical protein
MRRRVSEASRIIMPGRKWEKIEKVQTFLWSEKSQVTSSTLLQTNVDQYWLDQFINFQVP